MVNAASQSVASGGSGGGLHFYVVTPYDECGDIDTGVLDEVCDGGRAIGSGWVLPASQVLAKDPT